jgi:hypothetical protein
VIVELTTAATALVVADSLGKFTSNQKKKRIKFKTGYTKLEIYSVMQLDLSSVAISF